MKIIPAIDILDGKCVRLSKGKYDTSKIYNKNPVDVALEFQDNGVENLHIVDLDGARSNKIENFKVIEKIVRKTNLDIQFGGGIKSDYQIKIAFDSGVNKIIAGSIAVKKPEKFIKWIEYFGFEKIILGVDYLKFKVHTNGWLNEENISPMTLIKSFLKYNLKYVICTDIEKDGMLSGPSFSMYENILSKTEIKLISSGGIKGIDDLEKLLKIGCDGAIVGKAIYENLISMDHIKKFNLKWN
jgi:phosphoribosylformimino-5-aminoimidazole carboxamide ribotide isomerase